jgi:hypothetical protein
VLGFLCGAKRIQAFGRDGQAAEEEDGGVPVGDVEDAAGRRFYFLRSTARSSCCLFILERPSMPSFLASL